MFSQPLTFKQYLQSKEVLREAANTIPKRTAEYSVNKYCNIAVGESKQDKQLVPLRPKHKIFIDWLYEDMEHPTPVAIRVQTDNTELTDQSFPSHWHSDRLARWLKRNTREQS